MDRPGSTLLGVLLVLLLAPAMASAEGFRHAGASSCSVDSDYGFQVDAGGLRIEADEDADAGLLPKRIEISDGVLRVDGEPKAVSAADATRLRGIEAGVRGMVPDIAAVSREAIGITFDALGGVNAALSGNRRQAREFEALRARALARVDGMAARGEWSSALFGEAFEAEIESAAEAMAARFTPVRAVWMMVSGGIGRMERRVEKMEVELERSMAAREATLERHARALCDRLEALEQQQDAMEWRLEDGRPLRVFKVRGNDATTTAAR